MTHKPFEPDLLFDSSVGYPEYDVPKAQYQQLKKENSELLKAPGERYETPFIHDYISY